MYNIESTLCTVNLLIKMAVKYERLRREYWTFLFSLLKVTGMKVFLLHGCWEIHLFPFGTTFILITISGIKGSIGFGIGMDPANKEVLGEETQLGPHFT